MYAVRKIVFIGINISIIDGYQTIAGFDNLFNGPAIFSRSPGLLSNLVINNSYGRIVGYPRFCEPDSGIIKNRMVTGKIICEENRYFLGGFW